MQEHPLVSGTGAPEFIPHRPPRPEKSEGGVPLDIQSELEPKGDQPTGHRRTGGAGANAQERDQVLLGVTGSGKTFTMAKVIEATQRPALVLAPNKTLAAQLYGEFKSFFPDNAVEYFVSYYDYYQPEAYIPRTDTYIEKEISVNEQIDRMRHAATRALVERDDVIIVASRVLHLRYRLGRDLYRHGLQPEARRQGRAAPIDGRPGGAAIPPQRHEFRARLVSRARRYHRAVAGASSRIAPGASRCSATRWRASPSSIR